jgi:hypothetical protein
MFFKIWVFIFAMFLSLGVLPQSQAAKGKSKKINQQSISSRDIEPDDSKKIKSIYSSFQITSGTIIARDTVYAGYRTSFLTVQPELGLQLDDDWEAYSNVPMSWLTDQNGAQDRIIGRPEVGLSKAFFTEDKVKFIGNFATKLPLYDTSFGKSELYRSWEFAPGAGIDIALKNSTNHFFVNTNLAYNSDAKYTYGTYNDVTGTNSVTEQVITHPLKFRNVIGLMHESEIFTLGGSLHVINDLGSGTEKISSTAEGSHPESHEIKRLESWVAEVFASFDVTKTFKVNGGVSKGLKTEYDNTHPVFTSYDNFSEIADLAFNLGVVQIF